MKKRSSGKMATLAIATLILFALINFLDAKVFDKLNPFKKSGPESSDLASPSAETPKLSEMAGSMEPLSTQVQKAVDDKALALLIERAQGGDAEAQFDLGQAYMDGRIVEQNTEFALSWFKRAAKNGSSAAAQRLAQVGEEPE
ncbi:MAG: tetratricopeptide repeat protein [Alphaproteobacteria bacterium]